MGEVFSTTSFFVSRCFGAKSCNDKQEIVAHLLMAKGGTIMAKPTGFMDYKRVENGNVAPDVRITDFKDFHPKLDE